MGCWNETCMISSLPIFYGDPVVFYVIQHTNSWTDDTETAYPITTPMYGKYDDYGGVEVDENISSGVLLNRFGEKDIQELIKKIERGQKKIKQQNFGSGGYHEDMLSLAMMHSDVFGACKIIGYNKKAEEAKVNDIYCHLKQLSIMAGGDEFSYIDKKTSFILLNSYNPFLSKIISSTIEYFEKHGFNKKEMFEFAELYGKHYSFSNSLPSLRKEWRCNPYAGSQDDGREDHLFLNKVIRSHIYKPKHDEHILDFYSRVLSY